MIFIINLHRHYKHSDKEVRVLGIVKIVWIGFVNYISLWVLCVWLYLLIFSTGYEVFCVNHFCRWVVIFSLRSAEWIAILIFKIIVIVNIIESVILNIIQSKHIVSIIIFPFVEPWVPILMEVPTGRSCAGSSMSSISRIFDELNSSNEQLTLQSNSCTSQSYLKSLFHQFYRIFVHFILIMIRSKHI